jgi:phosphotransacetylase
MDKKPITHLNQLEKIAMELSPKSLIIPGGDRYEDLSVVKYFQDKNYINRVILVGNKDNMLKAADKIGLALNDKDLIDAETQVEMALKTVEIVNKGEADIILKGGISTPVLNREIIKIKTSDTISLVTLFQAGCIGDGRLFLLTDPGVTVDCNFDRMTALINNAADVASIVLGIDLPKVALLSANEKVIPALPSTVLEDQLTKSTWNNKLVYGPLSFDLAVDKESARIKGIYEKKGELIADVAGKADVLVCPGLDSANILYKVIMSMTAHNLAETASITMGVKVPYIILSRSEPEISKINSVALCCIMADRKGK